MCTSKCTWLSFSLFSCASSRLLMHTGIWRYACLFLYLCVCLFGCAIQLHVSRLLSPDTCSYMAVCTFASICVCLLICVVEYFLRLLMHTAVWRVGMFASICVSAETPTCQFNPLDAGRRYTGFSQPSKRRQTPVYRVCANFSTSPDPGIPGLRKHISLARPRYTGFIF